MCGGSFGVDFASSDGFAVATHKRQWRKFEELRRKKSRKIGHSTDLERKYSSMQGTRKRLMFKRQVAWVLFFLLAFAGHAAHAFFDPPWVTPAAPRAGETVSVNVHGGICDVFVDAPGYPQVTIQDTDIHIVRYGWHEGFQDFCIFGDWTITDIVGSFPQGNYTLTMDFLYDDPLFGPTIVNLGVIPFAVSGATPSAPIPTLDVWGQLALLILVAIVGAIVLRTRRRSHS